MRLRNLPTRIKLNILFSNRLIYTGLFVTLIGLFLIIQFAPNVNYKASRFKSGKIENNIGRLKSVKETNSTVNDYKIFEYSYEFNVDGKIINGVSFGKNKSFDNKEQIAIEYLKGNPSISRISGMRNGIFSLNTLYILILVFLIGMILILISIHKKRRLLNILTTNFEIIESNLLSKRIVPFIKINNGYVVWRLVFGFNINKESIKQTKYTTKARKFTEGQSYKAIKNPYNWREIFIIDMLPKSVKRYIEKNVQ